MGPGFGTSWTDRLWALAWGSLEAWRCRPIAVLNGMQDLLHLGFSGATRP